MDYSAEIITIGDEILYGEIIDTNSSWLASELSKLGLSVRKKVSVGDSLKEILSTLTESVKQSNLIIITGGLGPTNDDVTKKALCDFFDTRLKPDDQTLQNLETFFSKKGRVLTERNKEQALVPEKSQVLHNHWGTAPGLLFVQDHHLIVALPGVPIEMKNIFNEHLVPIIKKKFNTPYIIHKNIKTAGLGESWLADLLKDWEKALPTNISLAYLPSPGQVKLRLTAKGEDKQALENHLEEEVAKLREIAGKYIFSYDSENLELIAGKHLQKRGLSLATAESCTGGYLGHLITSVPGSSEWYKGGVIAYENTIKNAILSVDNKTLNIFGAVSEQTVKEMAEGVRKITNADIGISSSGIAGPGGGTIEKPVGTVWLSIAGPKGTISKKLTLGTDRIYNIEASGTAALTLLLENLKKIT
ncbi:competence/damage-inducible protein A [Cytophagaceae bacterium ABcell3]|nr:competence/damage-inducible protein A [Cytophagaceae bacterium ABcell3]